MEEKIEKILNKWSMKYKQLHAQDEDIIIEAKDFENISQDIIKLMHSKKAKTVKCIPYQLCPKCNGEGNMLVNNLHPSTVLSVGWQTCDVCLGAKIIPMHEIKF